MIEITPKMGNIDNAKSEVNTVLLLPIFEEPKLLYSKEEATKERKKTYGKAWYAVNLEKARAAHRAWYAANPGYSTRYAHTSGRKRPMAEATDCALYLGVYIAERILSHIFENVTRAPINNPGFDFICRKGYKIDVICSCIANSKIRSPWWNFRIAKNITTDYFLILAFNTRADLTPQHIWLIKGTELIRGRALNTLSSMHITNTPDKIAGLFAYEQHNKLEQTIACCNTLKGE